jgi:hypothetical protein
LTTARLAWADVTSFDLEADAAFHAALFGWEREDLSLPDAPGYSYFRAGGEVVAAIDPVPAEKGPPQWTVFVEVADLEAALGTIEAHGGTRVLAHPILDHGLLGLARDPAGAEFGLWQSVRMALPPSGSLPGSLGGAELRSADPAAASDFYAEAFGWRPASAASPGPRRLDAGGVEVAIVEASGARAPARGDRRVAADAPGWMPWLASPDLEADLARASSLGATVEARESIPPVVTWTSGARFALLARP